MRGISLNDKTKELKKVKWIKPKDALISFLWVTIFTMFMIIFIYGIDLGIAKLTGKMLGV